MIRMYPDGVVEGSAEEVATFKHIDAALTARNNRAQSAQKSLPAGTTKKVKSSRPKPASGASGGAARRRAIRLWANQSGFDVGVKGIIAKNVVDAYDAAHRSASQQSEANGDGSEGSHDLR